MFRKLTLFSVILMLIIVVSGSLVRLTGLNPDLFNQDLIAVLKGSGHEYLTAAIGLSVLILTLTSWRQQNGKCIVIIASLLILLLVVLQAMLGLWAKAIFNMPVVITGHVLLGLLTFWLLFWLYLQLTVLPARLMIISAPSNSFFQSPSVTPSHFT